MKAAYIWQQAVIRYAQETSHKATHHDDLAQKRRIRFLTLDEAEKPLAELPEYLAAMARFSLETGLRQANASASRYGSQAGMDTSRSGQGKEGLAVPLSDVAIQALRGQMGKHWIYVFTYLGVSITQVSTKAWWKAVKLADIKDFRWHDLRYTCASWHVKRGTPLHALQDLGGWESVEMVRRYAHLSGGSLGRVCQKHD